ncbi:DUF3598 domain-containing protein [Parasphingorhabdus sp.]|uniref:DUF3598 domain-containing protein n=1 Tax=Parasphingorhabdus sp. TaxID=2709688 RepID=UPI0032669AE5
MKIEEAMPQLLHHVGVWKGEYVHFDGDNREIDRHASMLICKLLNEPGKQRLEQSNIYDWPDNSRETRHFVGILNNDKLVIQNENIDGWVAPLVLDETERTLMVLWTKTDDASFRYYEMITLSEDGQTKNRSWHWYRDGRLFQRTLINEKLISRDWQAYDDPSYHHYSPRAPR